MFFSNPCDFCFLVDDDPHACDRCSYGNPCLGCLHYENDCEGQCTAEDRQFPE